jgi:hypothetical protein
MDDSNEIPVLAPCQANLLTLSERLQTLAHDTDRAGLSVASEHLLHLASQVLEQPDNLRA